MRRRRRAAAFAVYVDVAALLYVVRVRQGALYLMQGCRVLTSQPADSASGPRAVGCQSKRNAWSEHAF